MIQVIVRSQENLVDFLTQRLATIDGVRSTETFVMPYIIKPMTSWILPEVTPDPRDLASEPDEDGDTPTRSRSDTKRTRGDRRDRSRQG
jgi:hypothetical protein